MSTKDGDPGMSLRDWFAGMALQGILAGWNQNIGGALECGSASRHAYEYADAMLMAREAGNEGIRTACELEVCLAEAHAYAKRLCVALAAKHFPENTDFQPLPDLLGVLTQIDNITTALVREDAVAAEREACAKIITPGEIVS